VRANGASYPLLSFPDPITGGKPVTEWSRSEARAVLDWLIQILQPRTDAFVERIGGSWAEDRDRMLDRAEANSRSLLRSPGFIEPGQGSQKIALRGRIIAYDDGPQLTAAGEALGVDLGLLLARYLVLDLGDAVRWETERHGRTHVSYNLPVLRGGNDAFDPMLIGRNVAYALYNGSPSWERLSALYATWAELLRRTSSSR